MVIQRHAAFAEEAAEVEVLYASLNKMKTVTKKIRGSMARLDETGRTVQDAIGPIYGNTQRLQTQNTNIDRILAAIEKVKQPLDMRNREERIIRSRPDKVGLGEYIASVDRISQAHKEMKVTNLRSNQSAISEMSTLLAVGTANLENVFKDILRQDAQPIEPLKQITSGAEFPRISASKSAQLRTINTNISNYASQVAPPGEASPSAKAYAHERGQYVALSLQNLATASISTARKVPGQEELAYRSRTCAITTYTAGIRGMYFAEYENISPIFQREEWGPVLLATCQESLRMFASTLRDLDAHIKSHLITDCYLAYEIIDAVSEMAVEIGKQCVELKHALSDALKPIRETAKASLSMLLNDIRVRVHQMIPLPVDGGALPQSTDTIIRLHLMSTYHDPLASIMRSLGDGGWSQPGNVTSNPSVPTLKSFDVGADGKTLFVHYSIDTLEALFSSLDARAKVVLKGKSLQGVFLANNISVVERTIRTTGMTTLLAPAQPKIDSWKKRAAQLYSDAWKEPPAYLFDQQHTNKQHRPPSTGTAVDSATVLKTLSSKEKDAVKEKFKNFNVAFDELVLRHKAFKLEPDVGQVLRREVQMLVEALYARFWERYHEVDKGKGKYVKYDKAQLSSIIASLG